MTKMKEDVLLFARTDLMSCLIETEAKIDYKLTTSLRQYGESIEKIQV